MKISPIEIRQKTFEKNFRGYDKDEVDAFLLSLSQEWERVMDESKELKFKLQIADKEVSKLREVESTLYKTLKTAEDTGANIVEQANKSAELLTKEAQIDAEALLNDARVKAKNTLEDAQEKSRNVLFEAQKRLNDITLEIKGLETGKQILVDELQRVGKELLERADRIYNSPPLPDYNKLLFNPDEEAANEGYPVHETETETETVTQQEEITVVVSKEAEEEQMEVLEPAKEEVVVSSNPAPAPKPSTGSFFDQLS